ncbi:MBL fold metallo-hydrolase [Segnochrobactraceae bacterium EtOH-i3]
MAALVHDRNFDPRHGSVVRLSERVRRITAPNPGPFTFHGTNTFLIGEGEVAVIDPGPDDPVHIAAIVAAAGADRIRHIVVTHTHRDHSPGAALLKALTGAEVVAEGPHREAPRALEIAGKGLEAGGDREFRPDRTLVDGERVTGADYVLEAIATPGHTPNHLAFALEGTGELFSGDHVMGWSTTVVAPPDGAMGAYMESLDRLLARPEALYHPAHGGPIADAPSYVAALAAHRHARAAAVLDRLTTGPATIPEMVETIYRGLDPGLVPAARLSLFAHVEDLVGRGAVLSEDPVLSQTTRYRLAG